MCNYSKDKPKHINIKVVVRCKTNIINQIFMPNSKPFAILMEDHREVAKLFRQIEDTTERAEKTREELFAEIKTALDLHAQIEESILYPALEKVDKTHDLTLESVEEHAVVKQLLSELESEDQTTEEWTAKLTVLIENVEHHVEEEESDLFPKAEQALTEDELAALEQELVAAKSQA
jgi:hemerythrin-like domain-containing protein